MLADGSQVERLFSPHADTRMKLYTRKADNSPISASSTSWNAEDPDREQERPLHGR
ncbi:MAG: hypothetical protein UIQ97_04115 [Eggerthellaceae bacterium]|jgi:hypothetical protein